MMSAKPWSFFMGANTKDGFVSFFDGINKEDPARRVYAVKSGPGCGKSTCMQQVADALWEEGACEHIRCSSDPESLDGVILHKNRLALVDGTAPHAYDPAFPGARGGYITLSSFLKPGTLEAKAPRLAELSAQSKTHYANAYRLISASWRVDETLRATLTPHMPLARLRRRAEGIIARELPKGEGRGRLCIRLLDGITPQGQLCLFETADAMASRVYDLCDSYGFAAAMLEPIRDAALARGYTVYACLCPKDPSRLRHVLIPELSLAFVSSDDAQAYPGTPFRRIRVDSYLDKGGAKPYRGKARLLGKISASLMEDAVAEILAAHRLHDEMEALYRPHIDPKALDKMTKDLIGALSKA